MLFVSDAVRSFFAGSTDVSPEILLDFHSLIASCRYDRLSRLICAETSRLSFPAESKRKIGEGKTNKQLLCHMRDVVFTEKTTPAGVEPATSS